MTSRAQQRLAAIAVRVDGAPAAAPPARYHLRRRIVQWSILALIVAVPTSGLFRIDPLAGALVILDRQVWFADFFLIFGLWFVLASLLVFLYSVAGTVFCGWACPQNGVSEWANFMTRTLLGRRAEVSLDGAPPRITAGKNRVVNWAVLAVAFIGAALLIALVPLLYFYPAPAVWSFIRLRPDPALAASLYWIYGVFVLIVLLDITVLRHFWCRFICVYRAWQHSFKTRQTLHIAYDSSRSADCAGCNYCATRCFLELDPRSTDVFDSCINCGECVDACHVMHQKQGTPGLLRFEFGARTRTTLRAAPSNNEYSLLGRSRWALPFLLAGIAMFAWGAWTYEPYHLSVDHGAAVASRDKPSLYQIAVANKRYRPGHLEVRVTGLEAGQYTLSATELWLSPVEHRDITLAIPPGGVQGLRTVQVEVHADDGWTERFSFQHFAG